MKVENNVLLAAAVAAVLLPQSQSFAQGGALEEIIVTAERRATTETTTAISMNVLSAEDLANTQTKNIADLQTSTPNVTINNPGGFNSINIRGIGNSAIQPSIQVGVAVLQDGLLNAETITLSNQFLDLGSVEVLRGPQGTFIGTSSTGGAIRMNSVKPSTTAGVTGFVEGMIGKQSDVKMQGAVNLPVTDTFAARLAFNTQHRNSYFYSRGSVTGTDPTNPFQRPGSVNDMNGRISLLWAPNDSLEMVWRSEMNRSDNEGSPGQPNPRTFTLISPSAGALQGTQAHSQYWNSDAPADPNHDPGVISSNLLDSQFLGTVERHSVEVNYKFANEITLRSLTGFQHSENQYIEDGDGSFANAQVSRNDVGPDNNYYSQEFNLISPDGPFNWVVGASWFYRMTPVNVITETYTCGINSATGVYVPCQPQFTNVVPGFAVVNTETTTRSVGAFAQVNWKFVDTLELTVGARYNVDRNFSHGRDTAGGVVPVVANGGPSPGNCPADVQGLVRYSGVINWAATSCLSAGAAATYEDENPTWKVGLNWTPNDDNFVYLFYSRGYKAGGAQAAGEFAPEIVDDYELGWKGTFADGRATLSLGGFYMDYQDIQQQAFLATRQSAGNAVYNVGGATIQGLEAEFNARLGGFGIQANVGWVDSELDNIRVIDRTLADNAAVRAPGTTQDLPQCAPGVANNLVGQSLGGCVDWSPYFLSASGLRNIYSPEISYGVTLDYEFLSGDASWTPRVNFSHTDEQDVNIVRREEFWLIPKRDLTNVSLTYAKGEWTAQAFVNNVSDETYIAAIGTGGGLDNNTVVYGAPRTYGLRVRRNF
jgi:iron complex outermembrane recepter protein